MDSPSDVASSASSELSLWLELLSLSLESLPEFDAAPLGDIEPPPQADINIDIDTNINKTKLLKIILFFILSPLLLTLSLIPNLLFAN